MCFLIIDVNTQKPFHFNEPGSIKLNEINFDKMKEIQSPQQQSTLMFDLSKYIVINSQLVKPAELECSLCMRLLYNPVTTPCGHTFCAVCLERSLDHQDRCPLCKNSLADYLAERRQFSTSFLDKLIRTHYGNDYAERKKQHHEELRELLGDENEIPVFVCTLALPFAPCPLHIYEPRYRLMLRRAIETGRKQFGMCMYSERTPYHYTEYGCMLEIQTYQFTRDGRSIVTTVGGRRFRVLKSGTKDGYNVAKVEWVKDVRVEDEHEKSGTSISIRFQQYFRLYLNTFFFLILTLRIVTVTRRSLPACASMVQYYTRDSKKPYYGNLRNWRVAFTRGRYSNW